MVSIRKSLQASRCFWTHSVHTDVAQVFIACVGVMSGADDTEVRTEKLPVTFKCLREGLV